MELIIRLLIIAISFLLVFLSSSNMIKFNVACNPSEREALINFKHNLTDPFDKLSSWVVANDCCNWEGVICKSITDGDVVQLQLGGFSLSGELNSSLLELKHLYHLDLSFNNFMGIQIPAFLGLLQNLQYLHLSGNGFTGKVPPQLGNLSRLHYLDLSSNKLEGEIPITLGNFCNLEVLDLSQNKLQGGISRLFTNSSTCFAGEIFVLRLEYNLLSGRLPDELGSLKNLEELSLAGNSFSGSIPTSLGRLSSLVILDLRENKLNGSLPASFRNLSGLGELLISFEGVLTEMNLINLVGLRVLYISSMVLNVSREWVPPFQLREARFQNCSVGNRFPEWLRTQKKLMEVEISNAGISGSVPNWFWNMTSQFIYLNISHNQLEGDISNAFLKTMAGGDFYLSSNKFTGNLPLISSDVGTLDLSKNRFSGPISVLLCNPEENINSLQILDVSENQLSGMLPDCWFPWRLLVHLSLQSNNITGSVPSSMGLLSQLEKLHLQKNSLNGEFPSSLQNYTGLKVIDLGENRLTGAIPTWIGESLQYLNVLRLHSNKFNGEIPRTLCYLHALQILDLSHNNLSGSIPNCFNNFSLMTSNWDTSSHSSEDYLFREVKNRVDFVAKGRAITYEQSLLLLVFGIDLSSNNLNGEIPEELIFLIKLNTLNLSNNCFTGRISDNIGFLSSLESLDLSINRLSGSIPESLADLTFISYLNLSYNNLSGRIPSSTQLGTFPELSYTGNHDLCGFPLNECEDGQRQKASNGDGEGSIEGDEEEDWIEMKWFYMGLPFGFVVGFWCLFGVLLVNKSWRYAYFGFLDDVTYSLCSCLKQRKK